MGRRGKKPWRGISPNNRQSCRGIWNGHCCTGVAAFGLASGYVYGISMRYRHRTGVGRRSGDSFVDQIVYYFHAMYTSTSHHLPPQLHHSKKLSQTTCIVIYVSQDDEANILTRIHRTLLMIHRHPTTPRAEVLDDFIRVKVMTSRLIPIQTSGNGLYTLYSNWHRKAKETSRAWSIN